MAAASGPIRPAWDAPPPRWLTDFVDPKADTGGVLSLLERSEGLLVEPRIFFGTNMAIRRNVLFDVGGFNPDAFGGRRAWSVPATTNARARGCSRGKVMERFGTVWTPRPVRFRALVGPGRARSDDQLGAEPR